MSSTRESPELPLDLIKVAREQSFSEDGEPLLLELAPGLSAAELVAFETSLPCPLPAEVRELLGYCRGFDGPIEAVEFTGAGMDFEMLELLPHGHPIAHDGYGNYWVVDLNPTSESWAPIYFVCHDAPVMLVQSQSLAHFLAEIFRLVTPPNESAIDDVHEDRLFEVWRKNPGVLSHAECAVSDDRVLAAFAAELDPEFEIIDLRGAAIGAGLSWGRYGPRTIVRRCGNEAVFAYKRSAGLLERLFGVKR